MLDILKKEKKVNKYKALKTMGSCRESQMQRMFCKTSIVISFWDLNDNGAFIFKALINKGSLSSLNGEVFNPYMIKEALMAAR